MLEFMSALQIHKSYEKKQDIYSKQKVNKRTVRAPKYKLLKVDISSRNELLHNYTMVIAFLLKLVLFSQLSQILQADYGSWPKLLAMNYEC